MINHYEKYQTVGPRIVAAILDGLIFLPLGVVNYGVIRLELPPVMAHFWLLIVTLLPIFYTVVLHALYGQTFGKMAVKVKVVNLDENPITFHHAILRSLPQIFFSFLIIFLSKSESSLLLLLTVSYSVWSILDIVVFFASEKRRALHDIIAGTVVIKLKES